jgi:hypothetical protein
VSQQPNGDPHRTHRASPSETNGNGVSGPTQQSRVQPPQTVPSLEVLQAEFEQLVKSNQAKFAELAQSGTAPDPFFLIHARINHLIDSIAGFAGPNGPRWATLTRLEFERYIDGELSQAGPAARRMQLAEGARYTPEMIRALARQSGTLRRAH